MSERTVSENNKIWEAAKKIAEQAVSEKKAESEEERRKHKKRIIKICLLMLLIVLILIFASIAWFAMNRRASGSGMIMEAAGTSFELKTSGTSGLYDSYLDEVASGYEGAETTAGSQGIKWKLTKNTAEMENVYSGSGEPDMREITRLESSDYGIKPGDSGKLEFWIVPRQGETATIDLRLTMKGYTAAFDERNYKDDSVPLAEVTDSDVKNYLGTHVLFFYMDDNNKKHLITSQGYTVSVSQETKYTIYWMWPATLKEILQADIEGLNDADAAKELRRAFFEAPSTFLEAIGEFDFSTITVEKDEDTQAQETAAAAKAEQMLGKSYNQYATMYNNADQTIGDNVNYIMVDLMASASSGG